MVNLYEEMNEKIADLLLGCDDNGMCMYAGTYIKSLKEKLGEYQKIGTIDECREAREKQQEERPDYEGDGCDSDGNFIYDTWICPGCGARYEVDYDRYDYCPECGQKILWEDGKRYE